MYGYFEGDFVFLCLVVESFVFLRDKNYIFVVEGIVGGESG